MQAVPISYSPISQAQFAFPGGMSERAGRGRHRGVPMRSSLVGIQRGCIRLQCMDLIYRGKSTERASADPVFIGYGKTDASRRERRRASAMPGVDGVSGIRLSAFAGYHRAAQCKRCGTGIMARSVVAGVGPGGNRADIHLVILNIAEIHGVRQKEWPRLYSGIREVLRMPDACARKSIHVHARRRDHRKIDRCPVGRYGNFLSCVRGGERDGSTGGGRKGSSRSGPGGAAPGMREVDFFSHAYGRSCAHPRRSRHRFTGYRGSRGRRRGWRWGRSRSAKARIERAHGLGADEPIDRYRGGILKIPHCCFCLAAKYAVHPEIGQGESGIHQRLLHFTYSFTRRAGFQKPFVIETRFQNDIT